MTACTHCVFALRILITLPREECEVLRSAYLFVCMSVRLHVSKTACPSFTTYSVNFIVAVALSSSVENAIRYVFPVMWRTSWFHVMGPMRQNQSHDVKESKVKEQFAETLPQRYGKLTCYIESHSVTCHPTEVRILPLPPAKHVLDLATSEGCKAELTYVT